MEDESSSDVVAVLVYDGVPYALDGGQLEELEENGLEFFVTKDGSINCNVSISEEITPMNQPGDINTYYESSGSNLLVYSKAVYVTPAVQGPATITYGESCSITSSFSGSISLTIKRKIVADLGGSYSYSVTTNKEFGVSFAVPENTTSRIQFVPIMRHTIGTYCYDSFTSYDIDAYVPLKVNSFADGLYRRVDIAFT